MAKFFGIFFIAVTIAVTYGAVINTNTFADSNNLFAFKFLDAIFEKTDSTGESFIFSPYSIRTAAGLLYGGAGGLTATQMMTGFEFESDKSLVGDSYKDSIEKLSKNSMFTIANKIYVAEGHTIAPKFLELATYNFDSEVENIEFKNKIESAKNINNWVDEKTHGKIKEIVKPETLNENTRLLIANAIHFKGEWEVQFNKSQTVMEDFYTKPGEIIKVEMMHGVSSFKSQDLPDYGIKIAEYPFKNRKASIFFLAPMTTDKDLNSVQANLHDLIYNKNIFKKFRPFDTLVEFSMPNFKIDFEIDCLDIFTKMGMDKVSGGDADFSNILSPSQHIPLSKVIHKATIDINEEGTEAAAVTVELNQNRASIYSLEFTLNQSFLYFIRGNDGEIYFMGRYTGK